MSVEMALLVGLKHVTRIHGSELHAMNARLKSKAVIQPTNIVLDRAEVVATADHFAQ
jgi:hypothetical protein